MIARKMTVGAVALIVAGFATGANAKVRAKTFDYQQASTTLEGFIAWDDAAKGKRPAVLIFPTYTGGSDFEQDVARKLAARGYVAMVADVYGKGIHPSAGKEAGAEMGKYMGDRTLLRARAQAGLDRLLKENDVDAKKVATIGYCFGGAVVLQMARYGTDLKGVVSFHGNLAPVSPARPGAVKAKILVLTGAADSFVPPEQVEQFKKEMDAAKADYRVIAYPGAKHSFTNPEADEFGKQFNLPLAYNEEADHASWKEMQEFFRTVLK